MTYETRQQPAHAPAPAAERSLGELLGDLMRETNTLVSQEINLAKHEMTEKAAVAGKNAAAVAAGGAVAYIGLMAIVAGLILVLIRLGMAPWLSAFIIGAIVAGIGGYLVMKGLAAFKQLDPVPQQTVETLKEDVQWAKDQHK